MSRTVLAAVSHSKKRMSHLLLSGCNILSPPEEYSARSSQSPSNPLLTPAPLSSWLSSIGRLADVDQGWFIRPRFLASGLAHALIAYRSEGVDRCFAIGRNESGQLGVGFSSQESTRGLVEAFEGEEVRQVGAGVQSSYLLVGTTDGTALYTFGSLQRGRLGLPELYAPSAKDAEDREVESHIVSKATKVNLPESIKGIKELATGFEHLLLLTEEGDIFGTGCNTDGQLGLGAECLNDVYEIERKVVLPEKVVEEGGVSFIRAGADTSALITGEGNLWTWGNSEYGQGLQGKKIDQIHVPTPIDASFLPPGRRVSDFRCGGSFSLILDDQGSVYSAGFGALGLGPNRLESVVPQRIDKLEGKCITRIRAGWGWAVAVADAGPNSKLYSWGINNTYGRLGVGVLPSPPPPNGHSPKATRPPPIIPQQVYEPTLLRLPLRQLSLEGDTEEGRQVDREEPAMWEFGEVECGADALWVGLEEELD